MFYGTISNGGGDAVAVERQKVDCGGSFFFSFLLFLSLIAAE